MNPVEIKLLSAAYEQYQKAGSFDFSYVSPNFDDWFDALTAARQLYTDGLIDTDLYYVTDSGVRNVPGDIPPISFCITQEGLDAIRSERNLKG